jgi:hypothetical protein
MEKVIGVLRNNWRRRLVYVYEIPGDAEQVKTVGYPFNELGVLTDGAPIVTVENIDAWRRTISLFPITAVYE